MAPVKVFAPERIHVPAPLLVRLNVPLEAPSAMTLAILLFPVFAPLRVSVPTTPESFVIVAVEVKLRISEAVVLLFVKL